MQSARVNRRSHRRHRRPPGRRRGAHGAAGPPAVIVAPCLAAFALGLALVLFLLLRQPAPPPAPKPRLLFGVDVSKSFTPAMRKRCFGLQDQVIGTVVPPGSPVEAWTFAHIARRAFIAAPDKPADLWAGQDALLLPAPPDEPRGTFPSRVLAAILDAAKQASRRGEAVGVILDTDAEDADPAATAGLVRQLGQLPNVRAVWLVGVGTDPKLNFRDLAERTYRPLGSRAILSNFFEIGAGLARFQQLMGGKAK